MKISKSLLQNIAVGLLVAGSITSCEVDDDPIEFQDKNENRIEHLDAKSKTPPTPTNILETIEETIEAIEGTDTIPEPEPPVWDWGNCPGCGMG